MMILRIAFLPMRRNGIVDSRLDAFVRKERLQAVAMVRQDGIDMIDTLRANRLFSQSV
jgi:hypothetical protein